MLVDVSRNLVQMNGNPLMDTNEKGEAVEATVKTAIVNAVLSPVQNEKGIDKVKKYELAKRIYQVEGEIELTPEEVVLIKDRVGELYTPLIVGQVLELLLR